jgi:hypothetical protein
MMRATLLGFAAALLLLGPAQRALAADEGFCQAYTAAAVKAANEVRERQCTKSSANRNGIEIGFEGKARWSTDAIGHSDWCLASNKDTVEREAAAREAELGKCRVCSDYTTEALNAAKSVRTDSCGYDLDNPQWSEDRFVHIEWCMGVNSESIDHENVERRYSKLKCSRCRNYSDKALAARDSLVKNGCQVPNNPRWMPDGDGHYKWCMGLTPVNSDVLYLEITTAGDMMAAETDARSRELGLCALQTNKQGLTKAPQANVSPRRLPNTTVPPAAATKPLTTARQPSGSSAVDMLNPSGPCRPGNPNDPCKPKTKILSPGLLEGGGGAGGVNAPAAAGTPAGGAGSGTGGGGGSGSTSTYMVR